MLKKNFESSGFTTNELQFFAFRNAFFKACTQVTSAKNEEELWEKLPNLGFMLSKSWKDMTGQDGVMEVL